MRMGRGRSLGGQFLCEAQIHSIAERKTRLRGCASTQALHSAGDTAKVGGGARGPMGRGRSERANPGLFVPQ